MKTDKKVFANIAKAAMYITIGLISAIAINAAAFQYYTGDMFGGFKIMRTFHLIETVYPGEIDKKSLLDGALEGIVSKVGDKHSVFLDGDEFKAFYDQTTGSYVGVGIYIAKTDNDAAMVAGVIDDSPAQEQGIQRGDVIMAIDGNPTEGMALEDVSKRIRGAEGSDVTLTISRDGASKDYMLKRRSIKMKTVQGQILDQDPDIGYIHVSVFSENTGEEFTKEYNRLRKSGMKKMVLDLRNNPGGLVDQAVAVCSNFVPKDSVIVSFTSGNGEVSEYKAEGTDEQIPLVVLVNENPASAAEIVAGDIQDMKLGPIVGTTTYGKGTVQGLYQMDTAEALKLTVARYHTTSGREVDGVGITPDVYVTLQPDDIRDHQLEKALEILREK